MNQPLSAPSGTFAQRHPQAIIILHWLTVALVLAGVLFVLTRDQVGARELKRLLLDHHRSLGLLVLTLVGLRILTRLWRRRGMVRHELPWELRLASTAGHWGLYALLVVTPLLGWALTNAHGQDLSLFGLVGLPPLVAPDDELADTLADWHTLGAWSLLALVAAHSVAALWHHFVRRDDVLHSMLPWRAVARPPVERAAPASQASHYPARLIRH